MKRSEKKMRMELVRHGALLARQTNIDISKLRLEDKRSDESFRQYADPFLRHKADELAATLRRRARRQADRASKKRAYDAAVLARTRV